MKELSNVEIVLLQLLTEKHEMSGYEINQLIVERGYREWSGIGTTSIYTGLKKLEKKGFVTSFVDTKKKGKGPLPIKYKLVIKGFTRFKEEIKNIFIYSKVRDSRFDISIASIPIFKKEEIVEFLLIRKKNLMNSIDSVKKKYQLQGGDLLPFHVKALFKHSKVMTNEELKFIDYLIENVNKSDSNKHKINEGKNE